MLTPQLAILDPILSTEPNMVNDVEFVESLGSSDHNGIEFSVITQVSLKESKESVPAPLWVRGVRICPLPPPARGKSPPMEAPW